MCTTAYPLEFKDWKAYRVIKFSVNHTPAVFIYTRPVFLNKVVAINRPDPILPGVIIEDLSYPLDEIDGLLLRWFQQIDPRAALEEKLCWISTEEAFLLARYRGLPKAKVNLHAFVNTDSLSIDDLWRFDGAEIIQYNQTYSIVTFGHLPANEQPVESTLHYRLSASVDFKLLMDRLRSEVTPYS